MQDATSPIEILPMRAPAGAEIRCGDVRSIDDAAFRQIYRAWLDHLVVVVRDQQISDADLIEFSRRFGPLKSAAIVAGQDSGALDERPELHVVSNVRENGVPIGILGDGEVIWHTDMASFLQPPSASLLYALEIPPHGGDTFFANMYLAFDTLPDSLKPELMGLTVKHEVRSNSSGSGTGASHPLVCTHPETGCNTLFLGARSNTFVNELPREQSDRLLDYLWAHSAQPQMVWRHQWREGDIVVWDNRCLMHYREAFDPTSRRVLHRTQVQGNVTPSTASDACTRRPHSRGLLTRPALP